MLLIKESDRTLDRSVERSETVYRILLAWLEPRIRERSNAHTVGTFIVHLGVDNIRIDYPPQFDVVRAVPPKRPLP